MPSDDELRARYDRRTEQNRLAKRRQRARQHDAAPVSMTRQHDTGAQGTAVSVTPPQTPPVSLFLKKEIEKVGRLLEPLTVRGYEHHPDYWAELAATYPAARLAVEAYKIAAWFKDSAQKNRKVKSWPAFLDNWLKKAQRDATAAPASGAHPMPYQTPSPGKPPDPEPVLPPDVVLERIDPRVAERALLEAKRLTLPEKLELARNGRH